MATFAPEPPLTEPLLIPCLYATGLGIERSDHVVRLVFWVHMPIMGGQTEERRIIGRHAVPIDEARRFARVLLRMVQPHNGHAAKDKAGAKRRHRERERKPA